MRLRAFDDIFPDYYVGIPDEAYVRRVCMAHMTDASLPRDIYAWINREDCPYLREAYATTCQRLIEEWNQDEDHRLNSAIRMEVEIELSKIITYAQTDQMAEDRIHTQLGISLNKATKDASSNERICHLEQSVAMLISEIKEMKEHPAFYEKWPFYSPSATTQDKIVFENHLTLLCRSRKKSASADLLLYIKLKEQEGIICRPKTISAEYQIMVDYFAYPYTLQAYSNAS